LAAARHSQRARLSVAVADLAAARALLQRAQQHAPVRFYSARYRSCHGHCLKLLLTIYHLKQNAWRWQIINH
jgi:hypothetical protein